MSSTVTFSSAKPTKAVKSATKSVAKAKAMTAAQFKAFRNETLSFGTRISAMQQLLNRFKALHAEKAEKVKQQRALRKTEKTERAERKRNKIAAHMDATDADAAESESESDSEESEDDVNPHQDEDEDEDDDYTRIAHWGQEPRWASGPWSRVRVIRVT